MACRGSAVRVRLAPLGFQGFEDNNLIRLVQNLVHNHLALYFGIWLLHSMQGVSGSNPLGSNKFLKSNLIVYILNDMKIN